MQSIISLYRKEKKRSQFTIYHILYAFNYGKKIEKRFEGIGEQQLLTEATILDPRFKKRGFCNTSYERAYQKIIWSVTTIIQLEKQNLSENEVNAVQENSNEKVQFDIWKDFDLQVWFLLFIILLST